MSRTLRVTTPTMGEAMRGEGMRILVVDDEKFNLNMAKILIEANIDGCEVLLCNSPDRVQEMMSGHEVGVVLLDIVMPGTDGIAILKWIRSRQEYNDIQVIMFTGMSDQESFRNCFELGADDFISKPLNATEFIARMRSAIRARKNIDALNASCRKTAEQFNELQEITKELKETQSYLLQKEKMAGIGQLAAGVAHEINNPLGYVASNIKMLQKYIDQYNDYIALCKTMATGAAKLSTEENVECTALTAKEKKMKFLRDDIVEIFRDVNDGLVRITKIVEGLRVFSRIDSQQSFESYDLNEGIRSILMIAGHEIKFKARVESHFADLPAIEAVGGEINQVLLNVIVNAAQAISSQQKEIPGVIVISTWRKDDSICCSVQDDGIGIAEEDLKSIFNPFFTTKPIGQGTGLGLGISYDIIVNHHHGDIKAESTIGVGTKFTIQLPVKQG